MDENHYRENEGAGVALEGKMHPGMEDFNPVES